MERENIFYKMVQLNGAYGVKANEFNGLNLSQIKVLPPKINSDFFFISNL